MAVRLLPDTRELPTELLWNLTLREMRGRFKRSVLGWLWSVINPLASIAVYSVVFGVFFNANERAPVGDPSGLTSYPLYLVAGLVPWMFVANALGGAAQSITANESLVQKVYFPRAVLPGASTLAWLANFGVELAVFGVVLVLLGNMVLPWLPVVLLLMVLQTGFVFGLGLLLAAGNSYFRDVQHFLAIALNVWFYATPIVYTPDMVPEEWEFLGFTIPLQEVMALNPIAVFVDGYRDAIYSLRWPTLTQWGTMTALAVVSLAVGAWGFSRLEGRLAEEL